MMRQLRAWPSALLQACLPCTCALCGQVSAGVVCAPCRADTISSRPRCPRCANPLGALDAPSDAPARLCGACLAAPPAFDATVAAVDYASPVDQLLLQLKFAACLPLAPWFASLLRDQVLQQQQCARSPAAALPDLLVAVPLGQRRLAERGFNQAVEVARPLARLLGVPFDARLLRRVRETAPQSTVLPAARAANVRAAFASAAVTGLHVGVVDDVMTSGRTLDAVAATLKRAGALKVSNYVVARTPPQR